MPETLRSCAKTACRWPAAASLSYRYDTRQVWLLDLSPTPDPSLYDLCPHHADALVVPKGWTRVDDRSDRPAIVEPAAAERVAVAVAQAPRRTSSSRVLVSAGNRYESLARDLPRLAAELAAQPAGHGRAAPLPPEHGSSPHTTASGPAASAAVAFSPQAEVQFEAEVQAQVQSDVQAEVGAQAQPQAEADTAAQHRFEPPPAGAVPLHGEPPPGSLSGLSSRRDARATAGPATQDPGATDDAEAELAGQLVMPGLAEHVGAVVIDIAGSRRRRARGRGQSGSSQPGPSSLD